MIKLSLNSPEVSKQQTPAAFANTLAAAVEAASAQPVQSTTSSSSATKQAKQAPVQLPSNGLLTRGVRWLQHKGRSKKRMQMIETVSLGEKRFVALVKVDGREFLLGGAPSSVGMLADLGAHGLGDLLSLQTSPEANIETAIAAPVALEQPTPVAAAPSPQSQPLQLPEACAVEPLTLPTPAVMVETASTAAPVEAARVSITVAADEDESDWLAQDDLDTVFQSVSATETSTARNEMAKVVEIRPEPVVKKFVGALEQPAPVIAPQAIATVASPSFANANFTFQMWPAAAVAANTVLPVNVPASAATSKAKTGIDLESCPELLGEPYLLALVENSRGAAA